MSDVGSFLLEFNGSQAECKYETSFLALVNKKHGGGIDSPA